MLRFFVRRASAAASVFKDAPVLRPDETVRQLDKYIIGQQDAKIAVSIALRDQWRRQQLPADLQAEVLPNNILMRGPTGCGKTEVARRLAKLAEAPFVKVEATKYTEVGVYGADTESMVSDLVEVSAKLVEQRLRESERPAARERAIERLVALVGWKDEHERESIRGMIRSGALDDRTVDVEPSLVDRRAGMRGAGMDGAFQMPFGAPKPSKQMVKQIEQLVKGIGKGMGGGGPGKGRQPEGIPKIMALRIDSSAGDGDGDGDGDGMRGEEDEGPVATMRIAEALPKLEAAELDEAVEEADIDSLAVAAAEERGIIFVDEIDKLVRGQGREGGSAFSKGEGVQKELLALLEGTSVRTSFGLVDTSHVLFVCAGAFHQAKPSELLPELQGRLPVRVELNPLSEADLRRVLSETRFNLLRQQTELMATEGVTLDFTDEAVGEIAKVAAKVNSAVENIGARRLRTVVAKLLEQASFTAHELAGTTLHVDAEYVRGRLRGMASEADHRKYML